MEWLGFPTVTSYQGLDLSFLPLNYAYVTANTSIDSVSIYGMTDDCFNCPYELEKSLREGKAISWQVDTSVQRSWRIFRNVYSSADFNGSRLCDMRPTFGEYGVYRLDVGKCAVTPEVQPVNKYLPLLLTMLVMLGSFLMYNTIAYVMKRRTKARNLLRQGKVLEITSDHNNEESNQAVNTFRAILMILIIFMTTGGGGYPAFTNSWGGLSLAECLFFAYVWSIGVYIPRIMEEALSRQTTFAIMKTIFTRTFFIIALGFLIDSTVQYMIHIRYLRPLWDPLLRLGIAYLVVASAYVLTVKQIRIKSKTTIRTAVGNLVSLVWCWVLTASLLALIVILTHSLLSFNCLGNVTMFNHLDVAKAMRDDSDNCNNAFTAYMNKLFVADNKNVVDVDGYFGFSQGILGVLSTIIYAILGVKTGVIYLNCRTHSVRLKLWGFWAMLFGLTGVILAVVSYPINFNLWPIASIFFLSTVSMYLFMIIYYVVEVSNAASSVLITIGLTSLPVLCGHLLFSNSLPFRWGIDIRNHLLYLLQNYWIISLWIVISFMLNKKNIRFDM